MVSVPVGEVKEGWVARVHHTATSSVGTGFRLISVKSHGVSWLFGRFLEWTYDCFGKNFIKIFVDFRRGSMKITGGDEIHWSCDLCIG